MDIYVARQPIFNKDKNIYGYELLFRESLDNFFPDVDGDTATSKVLSNSFFSIGIEQISGKKTAFVNFTENLLKKKLPLLFPQNLLVVEILEHVDPNETVLNACKEISGKGYELALDDFFYQSKFEPLIALANIIKIDFRALSPDEIENTLEKLSNYNVNFLAEKVETYEEFKRAGELGFKYYQGYFFSKPEILVGKEIPSAALSLLEIIAEVNKEDFKFNKVEQIIARDVSLSYKLLRYINSAFFRRTSEISSIKQAIVLLGRKKIIVEGGIGRTTDDIPGNL